MDELPQLWNIFRGDMSFVGPRPEWSELVKKFRVEIPGFDRRHAVTPGLTGIAQIYGHSELPRRQKLRYDLVYIKRQSFWLDLRLVFISFLVTFTGKWEDRSAKLPWLLGGRRTSKRRMAAKPSRLRSGAGAFTMKTSPTLGAPPLPSEEGSVSMAPPDSGGWRLAAGIVVPDGRFSPMS